MKRIFVINPGSTSTKTAVFEDDKAVWMSGGHHPASETAAFHNINEQYEYRKEFILNGLKKSGIPLKFDAVIGRGGLTKPLQGGVYTVNEKMVYDLQHAKDQHACNLGAIIAYEIAHECGCPAFMADPGVVDELQPLARITGLPFMKKRTIFHALNSKAVSRKYAKSIGRKYEDINVIVVHLGGGISVGAHCKGKVIDVNNALNGDGPFSPERSGTLPMNQLVDLCFSGKYSQKQIMKMITGQGGIVAHLGTNDMITVSREAEEGNEPYRTVLDAMLYNVAKQVGAMYVALDGQVDAIIYTGGISHSKYCIDTLKRRTSYMAQVVVMPGEGEMESLAFNALGALNGELEIKEYV
ncbi:butyrate kinase [Xylanibacter caecicola]|uniref:butyrate kinase n=1 Tax=Xylanibacter caecicola TaxID=2736294 RepID=UPI00258FD151|nr:butyrate kinase [Xylanibacter caecicola]